MARTDRLAVAGVLGGAASTQLGAAVAANAFPLAGPGGVVALRQAVAAVLLLAISRPDPRRLGRRAFGTAAALGVALAIMNLAIYAAIDGIGLGLAVTIEFLGPLAVALLASRRPRDAVLGAAALLGVALVAGAFGAVPAAPGGVLLALLAAAAWASYIVLSQRTGALLPGIQGTALASLVAASCSAPLLVIVLLDLPGSTVPFVLGIGLAAGVLSSAVPYALDLVLLRRMSRGLFGVLQSSQPVAAALWGFLLLGERIGVAQAVGIALVCGANVLAVRGSER